MYAQGHACLYNVIYMNIHVAALLLYRDIYLLQHLSFDEQRSISSAKGVAIDIKRTERYIHILVRRRVKPRHSVNSLLFYFPTEFALEKKTRRSWWVGAKGFSRRAPGVSFLTEEFEYFIKFVSATTSLWKIQLYTWKESRSFVQKFGHSFSIPFPDRAPRVKQAQHRGANIFQNVFIPS